MQGKGSNIFYKKKGSQKLPFFSLGFHSDFFKIGLS
jgi:hypothetical protein